jgi:hypothetical protein
VTLIVNTFAKSSLQRHRARGLRRVVGICDMMAILCIKNNKRGKDIIMNAKFRLDLDYLVSLSY